MRKIITLFLLTASCVFADDKPKLEIPIEEWPEVELLQHYSVWFYSKHGCPIGPTGHLAVPIDVADCKKEKIEIKANEFKKARELAKKVFDLKDKKK